MNLRELLDRCQNKHSDDWVEIPFDCPATAMVSGVVDPGFKATDIRPLTGNHLAVYAPEPTLSMCWLVPEEAGSHTASTDDPIAPEWMEADKTGGWKGGQAVRDGYVVILLCGSPVWQEWMSYATWGAGVGGYVPRIEQPLHDGVERGYSAAAKWISVAWSVSLAAMLSNLSRVPKEWWAHDPIGRLQPEQIQTHPIDLRSEGAL